MLLCHWILFVSSYWNFVQCMLLAKECYTGSGSWSIPMKPSTELCYAWAAFFNFLTLLLDLDDATLIDVVRGVCLQLSFPSYSFMGVAQETVLWSSAFPTTFYTFFVSTHELRAPPLRGYTKRCSRWSQMIILLQWHWLHCHPLCIPSTAQLVLEYAFLVHGVALCLLLQGRVVTLWLQAIFQIGTKYGTERLRFPHFLKVLVGTACIVSHFLYLPYCRGLFLWHARIYESVGAMLFLLLITSLKRPPLSSPADFDVETSNISEFVRSSRGFLLVCRVPAFPRGRDFIRWI